ncbi:hypothetical protein HanIR_Chr15g0737841 [Helianthus annuus]|nr:hypothetical protein HanIR_Chr15g0737841 [Helianthus annuus]
MKDLFQTGRNLAVSNHKKELVRMIILVACWVIWKTRNELVFSWCRPNIDKIFGELQAMSFLWLKNRAKQFNFEWNNWVNFSGFE